MAGFGNIGAAALAFRLLVVALVVVPTFLAPALVAPARAQSVDLRGLSFDDLERRVSAPIAGVGRIARALCERGEEDACAVFDRLRNVTLNMLIVKAACAAGRPQACEFYELGAAELAIAYRAFERADGTLPEAPLAGELIGPDGLFSKAP